MRLTFLACLTLLSAAALSAAAGKVTFREDHTILVDGKPYFPIGLYYCGEELEDASGRQLKELRGYGFNTLGFYRAGVPGWEQELDRAARLGFKVWVRGTDGFAIDSPEIEKRAVAQVRRLRGSPALLFWEFQDEPILNKVSVEGSRKGYALVKREDPDHPMLVVEWPGAVDRFNLWRGIGDIVATDLYPIPRKRGYGRLPNHDITQMRDYLEALRKGYGDKPRLLVLQAWAWEPLKDGEEGYPTPRESRFMAYQAVIHGAKGIHYYGQYHCTKPNSASALDGAAADPATRKAEFARCLELNKRFWDRHRAFFKELDRARSLFVLPLAAGPDRWRTGDEGIEFTTRAGGGQQYVLAVNASPRPRNATFRLPVGSAATDVHVLFEARKVPVKDGTIRDVFQPYDVHVYATTPFMPPPLD